MTIRMTTTTALAALLIAAPVSAQGPWTLDFRAGAALPTQDLGEDEIATGFGLEGALGYRFIEHLAAYVGWDWHKFTADQSFAGSDMDFEETGYVYGLRFEHPFSGETGPGTAYTLLAGGTYDHLEVENSYRSLSPDVEVGDTTAEVDLTYVALEAGITWSF